MAPYVKPLLRDRLLRPREAAQLAGVPVGTVHDWRERGRLEPALCTPGGHGRYRRQDVLDLMAARE
jgi:DNA-binding transcriptional MerR regulator